MRFYTFLRDFANKTMDDDVIVFYGWIVTSEHPKKLPHAGIPQITLFIRSQNPSNQVKDGFVKACEMYFYEPKNILPIEFKDNIDVFIHFVKGVYYNLDS